MNLTEFKSDSLYFYNESNPEKYRHFSTKYHNLFKIYYFLKLEMGGIVSKHCLKLSTHSTFSLQLCEYAKYT